MFLDLKATGPFVIEPPKQSLCVVDDFWFRYVTDMGIAGPDKGEGGKYLFLPPGYDGDIPEGYFVCHTPTFTNWVVLRALGGVPAMKETKVYPLSAAADPPPVDFINIAARHFNTVHANDFSFYEEVNTIVQEEPTTALDPEWAALLAGIGIVHGRPFTPDERRRGILDNAARAAAAISRALVYSPRDPEAAIFEGSSWSQAFIGGSYEFLRYGARLLDARTSFHYFATVITPAMAHAQVGAGSAYAYTAHDADGNIFDGAKTYAWTLPPDPPAKNFLVESPDSTPTPENTVAAPDGQPLSQCDEPWRTPLFQMTMVPSPSGSEHNRPRDTSTTGSRRFPARVGFPCSASLWAT